MYVCVCMYVCMCMYVYACMYTIKNLLLKYGSWTTNGHAIYVCMYVLKYVCMSMIVWYDMYTRKYMYVIVVCIQNAYIG